ncbi:MAG: phosphatase PAP2 family protein [Cyclobacteriaceae bacterium]|nr:phosphatase PAP2 family protein [Cyclobacteriaceae bacterium]
MELLSRRSTHRISWLFAGVVTCLVIAALMVPKGEDVLWINGNHHPSLDLFFSVATHLGEGWVFLPFMLFYIRSNGWFSLVLGASLFAQGILCSVLKRQIFSYLTRPATMLDHSLLHFVPGVDVHSNYSFPSGHTATAFCLAFTLSLLARRWQVTLLAMTMSLIVGYSRIYLLQHYLMDVAAGAAVGLLSALLIWNFFKPLDRTGSGMWRPPILQP